MKDWEFEKFLGAGVMVGFLFFVLGVSVNAYHEKTLKAEAVKAGQDAIAVMCLYDLSTDTRETCNIYVTKKGSN